MAAFAAPCVDPSGRHRAGPVRRVDALAGGRPAVGGRGAVSRPAEGSAVPAAQDVVSDAGSVSDRSGSCAPGAHSSQSSSRIGRNVSCGIGSPLAAADRLSSASTGAPTAPASWYASLHTRCRTFTRASSAWRFASAFPARIRSALVLRRLHGLANVRGELRAAAVPPADGAVAEGEARPAALRSQRHRAGGLGVRHDRRARPLVVAAPGLLVPPGAARREPLRPRVVALDGRHALRGQLVELRPAGELGDDLAQGRRLVPDTDRQHPDCGERVVVRRRPAGVARRAAREHRVDRHRVDVRVAIRLDQLVDHVSTSVRQRTAQRAVRVPEPVCPHSGVLHRSTPARRARGRTPVVPAPGGRGGPADASARTVSLLIPGIGLRVLVPPRRAPARPEVADARPQGAGRRVVWVAWPLRPVWSTPSPPFRRAIVAPPGARSSVRLVAPVRNGIASDSSGIGSDCPVSFSLSGGGLSGWPGLALPDGAVPAFRFCSRRSGRVLRAPAGRSGPRFLPVPRWPRSAWPSPRSRW